MNCLPNISELTAFSFSMVLGFSRKHLYENFLEGCSSCVAHGPFCYQETLQSQGFPVERVFNSGPQNSDRSVIRGSQGPTFLFFFLPWPALSCACFSYHWLTDSEDTLICRFPFWVWPPFSRATYFFFNKRSQKNCEEAKM